MVIVNYNDYKTTKRLLDNVKNYKILKEIVVVDNKSTDDSLENLQRLKNKKITIYFCTPYVKRRIVILNKQCYNLYSSIVLLVELHIVLREAGI